MNKKEIWSYYLNRIQTGKEFLKEKKLIVNTNAYLQKIKEIEKGKARQDKQKNKNQLLAMTELSNGLPPATQKQIRYINLLLKKSKKKYDYFYPRDKYIMNSKMAGSFIGAIRNQTDFSFNMHRIETKKEIQKWRDNILIEKNEDRSYGINND
jgi:hypothetical protein